MPMEVVFLIGSIQAVFLALLVFMKQNKMLADKFLAFWLLFMGLHLFVYYMYLVEIMVDYPYINGVTAAFPMLEGAFTFLYVSIITSKVQRLKWNYLIHISHYLIFTLILNLIIYGYGDVSPTEVIYKLKNEDSLIIFFGSLFNIYLGPIYMIASLFLLRKHKRMIGKNFSYTEEIDLKWLKYVLAIMIFVWVVVVVANGLSDFTEIIQEQTGANMMFASLTVAIFLYGFFGIKQQIIYAAPKVEISKSSNYSLKETSNNQYKKSGLKKDASKKYLQKLVHYMDEETPYLNGKLTIKEVALALEISSNHLSQVINENLDKNFFDFVNEYRIDFVKQKMEDPKNNKYTILSMAYDSGFNSKSGFNAIFKKYTDQTPSQYLKTL